MKSVKYTKEFLEPVILNNTTMRGVLDELHLKYSGGNYSYIKKLCVLFDISREHFTGKPTKEVASRPTITKEMFVSSYLIKGTDLKGHTTLKRLISFSLRERKCEECGLDSWRGKPIPLEIDHIDGDHFNNEISNIRIICPNCHTQTPTYCGKNKKRVDLKGPKVATTKVVPNKVCSVCGSKIGTRNTSLLCREHSNRSTKINWPSRMELEEMLKVSSFVQVGKNLGVSDNAIRKHLKSKPL